MKSRLFRAKQKIKETIAVKRGSAMQDTTKEEEEKAGFLDKLMQGGMEMGKDELEKGKLKLQKSLGLGAWPNAVPPGEPDFQGPQRKVEIGWHPVGGSAGKWFAEETKIGKLITENIHNYPDPTQHWAIIVGDYAHELWMDEEFHVIYINEKVKREEWCVFDAGKTTFNDEALRQAGEMTIFNMRKERAAYNLITNNCQTFASLMLDAVHSGAHKRFATSFAVYQRAFGPGAVLELFPNEDLENESVKVDEEKADEAVHHAQQVMDENTIKVERKT